jgi:hypothetical protein
MEGGRTPVIEAGVQSLQGGARCWSSKSAGFRPGQLEPEPVVASADQEVARKVLELIRESLREEVQDEPMTKLRDAIRRTTENRPSGASTRPAKREGGLDVYDNSITATAIGCPVGQERVEPSRSARSTASLMAPWPSERRMPTGRSARRLSLCLPTNSCSTLA